MSLLAPAALPKVLAADVAPAVTTITDGAAVTTIGDTSDVLVLSVSNEERAAVLQARAEELRLTRGAYEHEQKTNKRG